MWCTVIEFSKSVTVYHIASRNVYWVLVRMDRSSSCHFMALQARSCELVDNM